MLDCIGVRFFGGIIQYMPTCAVAARCLWTERPDVDGCVCVGVGVCVCMGVCVCVGPMLSGLSLAIACGVKVVIRCEPQQFVYCQCVLVPSVDCCTQYQLALIRLQVDQSWYSIEL